MATTTLGKLNLLRLGAGMLNGVGVRWGAPSLARPLSSWALFKPDPGPCPVDDAPHTTCVGPSSTSTYAMPNTTLLPARDRATPRRSITVPAGARPGAFTTATYRRKDRT